MVRESPAHRAPRRGRSGVAVVVGAGGGAVGVVGVVCVRAGAGGQGPSSAGGGSGGGVGGAGDARPLSAAVRAAGAVGRGAQPAASVAGRVLALARAAAAAGRAPQRRAGRPGRGQLPGRRVRADAGEGDGARAAGAAGPGPPPAGARCRCGPGPRPSWPWTRPGSSGPPTPAAAATAARWPTAPASRCAPTWPWRSTAWPPPPAARPGSSLFVSSGFRSDAEQAKLFAAHPDPKWVAPPGESLHRYATELDLGPAAAYAWLAANARRFGFLQRYSWEPWHYGYTRSPGRPRWGSDARAAPDPAGTAAARSRASSPSVFVNRSPGPLSAGTSGRRSCPLRSTRSPTSTRSPAHRPEPRASRSSCRAPRWPTACATPSMRRRRSTPRRT